MPVNVMLIKAQDLIPDDVVIADKGAHMRVNTATITADGGVFIVFTDGIFTTLPPGTQVTALARAVPEHQQAAALAAYNEALTAHTTAITGLIDLYRHTAADTGEMTGVAAVSGHIQHTMIEFGDPVKAAQFGARQLAFCIRQLAVTEDAR